MSAEAPEVSFDRDFWRSVGGLQPIEQSKVVNALNRFSQDPNHPGLNLEALSGNDYMSVRASQELRILLYRRGNTFVWLFAGRHDEVYAKAQRGRFLVNPHYGFVGFVEPGAPADGGAGTPPPSEADDDEAPQKPLNHWRDDELVELGFDPSEVDALRGVRDHDELLGLALSEGWSDETFDALIEAVEITPEEWRRRRAGEAPPTQAAEQRLRAAIGEFGALAGLSPLMSEVELRRLAAAPVEEWMLFLHPDQRSLVTRSFSGPARVRGAAGTGKTVVILHRAAELARRSAEAGDPRPVLVTTYIKSLPPVLERIYRRLPSATTGTVEFLNVDKLAYRVCAEAGERPSVDTHAIDAAFAAAWKKVVTPGSAISKAKLTRSYVQDEIRFVIKGRGLRSLDDYLDVRRTGRRTQFGDALRRQAWQLREEWDLAMAKKGTVDFPDVVVRARDLARERVEPTFSAVLIDEAQDLTLAGLQLLRALANGSGPDRPDALFISGDGAQRIYAGGFTLAQAGVEVRGRTTVLRQNYRNTREVFEAALAVAGSSEVEDLEEVYLRSEEVAVGERSGAPVEVLAAATPEEELDRVVERLRAVIEQSEAIAPGDTAVLCATNGEAASARKALLAGGLPVIDLAHYDGTPSNEVKVGTHHRAKGLEFKAVFLPGLSVAQFPRPRPAGMDETEHADNVALQLSALFVAMTRARDLLVISCTGEPSGVLGPLVSEAAVAAPE